MLPLPSGSKNRPRKKPEWRMSNRVSCLSRCRTSTTGPFKGHDGSPFLASYWFARLCVRASGYWPFILSYGRSNGNWLAVSHSPPVSYTARNLGKPAALLSTFFRAGFLLCLFFDSKERRRYVPQKRRLIFNGLYGVIRTERPPLVGEVSANFSG
jgi:hypothetical protein